MGKLVRYQPPTLGSGWQPVTQPQATPAQSVLAVYGPKVAREVVIFGLLIFAATKAGIMGHPAAWLAILIGRGLVGVLVNVWREKRVFRTVLEWAAVAALAVIVAAALPATPPTKVKAPKLKRPAIEANVNQTDALNKAREIWADAYAQIIGQGSSTPVKKGR